MNSNRRFPRRRSVRLSDFDYSQPGSYFLTICSARRQCIFGSLANGTLVETALGRIVRVCWQPIPEHFPHVETDDFVLMPNHLHAILNIKRPSALCGRHASEALSSPSTGSVPTIVRTFKAAVTRQARELGVITTVWQSGYFEHVIRDAKEYAEISNYIALNPLRWRFDESHPKFIIG